MAKSKFDKGISRLDTIFIEDPRRAIVIGAFIVVAIIILVIFWSRIKNLFANLMNRSAATSQLNDVTEQTGEYPTMGNATYYTLANQVYNACKGFGTDEDAIYNVFNQMNNTADVYKLIQVFGTKDNKTLPMWIRGDLNRWEIKNLNNILANKGINYAF